MVDESLRFNKSDQRKEKSLCHRKSKSQIPFRKKINEIRSNPEKSDKSPEISQHKKNILGIRNKKCGNIKKIKSDNEVNKQQWQAKQDTV